MYDVHKHFLAKYNLETIVSSFPLKLHNLYSICRTSFICMYTHIYVFFCCDSLVYILTTVLYLYIIIRNREKTTF